MTVATHHIPAFDRTLQLTHNWLHELQDILGLRDQRQAYKTLRAVLHALRDRLTPEEAVDLGAQLPMLVRGFYYEGWRPSATPTKQRTKAAFLEAIPPLLSPDDRINPELAAGAVFKVLSHRISEGEIGDVKHCLPEEVRSLWPNP